MEHNWEANKEMKNEEKNVMRVIVFTETELMRQRYENKSNTKANLEGHSGQWFISQKAGLGIWHRRVNHTGQWSPHIQTQWVTHKHYLLTPPPVQEIHTIEPTPEISLWYLQKVIYQTLSRRVLLVMFPHSLA